MTDTTYPCRPRARIARDWRSSGTVQAPERADLFESVIWPLLPLAAARVLRAALLLVSVLGALSGIGREAYGQPTGVLLSNGGPPPSQRLRLVNFAQRHVAQEFTTGSHPAGYDFCPGGALEVPDGDAVVPVINRIAPKFSARILAQDWHPPGHLSFASSHEGKTPFETATLPYGEQVLWPDHCVRGTEGAAFHRDLTTDGADLVIRKGFRRAIDSYSAFYENDHSTSTGLAGYLRSRGISRLFFAGLATDFCVAYSAIDGAGEGFECAVIEDASRGIDLDGSMDAAWEQMAKAQVARLQSSEL